MTDTIRSHILHFGIILLLGVLYFVLPEYHSGNVARIMVFAVYAMGYNLLFGYTGLLSLGHALFFASGMYGLGIAMRIFEITATPALIIGIVFAAIVSAVIGFLALRTKGVAFMIVTLMFAQAGYLTVLYFGEYTRGDEGFVIAQSARTIAGVDLSSASGRYFAALVLFTIFFLLIAYIARSGFGLALIGIRENEMRAKMLGYNVARLKLKAVILSGLTSGAAGAAFALLFGYVGATFATTQYSIFPLLWVLLGGAGTTIGPLIGTAFMFYLIDYASSWTTAYMLVAGVVLLLLTLYAPHGIAGYLRKRWLKWLP